MGDLTLKSGTIISRSLDDDCNTILEVSLKQNQTDNLLLYYGQQNFDAMVKIVDNDKIAADAPSTMLTLMQLAREIKENYRRFLKFLSIALAIDRI